jgi:hypothetical protein
MFASARDGREPIMEMLWYVLGLVAMFYFGYLVAALMVVSRRQDDAEINELKDEPPK